MNSAARFSTGILKPLKRLFWNDFQRRLRTGWRLILQLGRYAGLLVAGGILLSALQQILFDVSTFIGSSTHTIVLILEVTFNWLILLVSLWLAARILDRRPFRAFGFNLNQRWWADFAFGLALGALLMAGIFLAEYDLGWLTVTGYRQSGFQTFSAGVLFYLAQFIAVGIQEESLSRGYWLRNLAEGFHLPRWGARTALWLAYVLSSSIFGLLHLANPHSSLVSILNLILAGFLLGLPFVLAGELALSIGLHITWNFFQGVVFGLPVSGMHTNTSFLVVQQAGPQTWTGGNFGPEAGLIGLLAMLIGAGLIVMWIKINRGKATLRTDLAVYQRMEFTL